MFSFDTATVGCENAVTLVAMGAEVAVAMAAANSSRCAFAWAARAFARAAFSLAMSATRAANAFALAAQLALCLHVGISILHDGSDAGSDLLRGGSNGGTELVHRCRCVDIEGEGRAGGRLGAVAREKSRVTKAIVLTALVAGRRRGSFLGKKASSVDGIIRTSRRCAIAHHLYPRFIYSYVGDVENK